MTFKKENCFTAIDQAKDLVPGFRDAFALFEERVVLDRPFSAGICLFCRTSYE